MYPHLQALNIFSHILKRVKGAGDIVIPIRPLLHSVSFAETETSSHACLVILSATIGRYSETELRLGAIEAAKLFLLVPHTRQCLLGPFIVRVSAMCFWVPFGTVPL